MTHRYVDPGGYKEFSRWRAYYSFGQRMKAMCGLPVVKLDRPPEGTERHVFLWVKFLHFCLDLSVLP